MAVKKHTWYLLLIFMLVLGVRLYFAFQSPYFANSEAYSHIRQIESIKATGLPIYNDELSYGGRILYFPPLFHYIMALFTYIMPTTLALKIIPNLFITSLVIICYLIALHLTKQKGAAIFTAFISGFIPVLFGLINSVSPYTLTVPLTFLAIYCFLKLNKKNHVYGFILLLIFLSLMHPSVILLVAALLSYLLFIKLAKLKLNREEIELALFATFLVFWISFIIYKKAFLFHGLGVIWQNVPTLLLQKYFAETGILDAMYKIGYIPLVYGIYTVYTHLFKKEDKKVYFLITFAISITILLWLRLIQPVIGYLYLGVIMTLLFSQCYVYYIEYIKKTRFARLKIVFIMLLYLTFALTSIIPSLALASKTVKNSVQEDKLKAMEWLKANTEEQEIILANLDEGSIVTGIAERKDFMDTNFLLIQDINKRFSDLEKLYTLQFETEAIRILDEYKISHIVLSKDTKKIYGIEEISYTGNKNCFDLEYKEGSIEIYRSLCRLQAR